ncbi:MAG: pyridine nucleotide-disulfide oxidoreductase [Myxococcales bacterium SG8_38_1]|jgi:putative flavoprotein involved in K+ transport|nr:MAG: pyridine nucleotide-disulfide oxidoreductase [Myxococcales bacterium SG8_38_1]
MKRIDTIIIGGGQAGLAMSRCLTDEGIDHVILERGRVAERWRSERWDSLRLLSPKWHSRLPGFSYQGDDPDGFMTMPEVISYFEQYARSFSAPVQDETTVSSVRRASEAGYCVRTNQGDWLAPTVVVATGHCGVPFVPKAANEIASDVHQVVPSRYRNPEQLPDGGVLVVGASASGIQLAQEIHRSGRPVTLAVGRHTRIPRRYRGRDITWWLETSGMLSERADRAFNLESARRQPSLQLVGTPDKQTLDLAVLQDEGVRLTGRLSDADGTRVSFCDDLQRNIDAAEHKLDRVLGNIDRFIDETLMAADARDRRPAIRVSGAPTELDLRDAGISTVLWATGYRREYPWLNVPVLNIRGEIIHDEGVTNAAGLYALGLNFQRTRKSSFIDGVGEDARALAAQLARRFHRSSIAA